jgi:hypothetical protein
MKHSMTNINNLFVSDVADKTDSTFVASSQFWLFTNATFFPVNVKISLSFQIELKKINPGFYMFDNWRSTYQEGRREDPICVCSDLGPGFPLEYVNCLYIDLFRCLLVFRNLMFFTHHKHQSINQSYIHHIIK